MQDGLGARRAFVLLWAAACVLKLVVAARLPLFVDEAFYWQEGRHLAPAYSDLPGMTAWLARLGTEFGGDHLLALRMPFLLVGAFVPWWVARIGRRWFGDRLGWHAGSLAVLMPLSGTLGLLALPDVPLALATVLCLHAGTHLTRQVSALAVLELGIGLALGALSHYRFAGVMVAGAAAMLVLPQGRRLLEDPRVLLALAVGLLAWAPLLMWNLDHGDAGVRFQFVDRHPWALHAGGLAFLPVQAAMVTPLLLAAMLRGAWHCARPLRALRPPWRFLGLFGGLVAGGFFLLGFFTDAERVSFHWPLPAWLALLPLAALLLQGWPRHWRRAAWATTAAGAVLAFAWLLAVSIPAVRAELAGSKHYPRNFAGWDALAAEVRGALADMPDGTVLVGDSFKVGAQLGFAMGDPDIRVLPHPLNAHHGRSPQLALWGLLVDQPLDSDVLLVAAASDVPFKNTLQYYQSLCDWLGPLPPPQVLAVDNLAQRFLLFRLPPGRAEGQCTLPALAWMDAPAAGAVLDCAYEASGWAFKDGVGVEAVELLLDGRVLARADYGRPAPQVAEYWRNSTDPTHPDVGFVARGRLPDWVRPGRHRLALRVHGRDGSVEDGWMQLVRTPRCAAGG
ncbi:glycosyltransferase family 39 protein [Pseudoxanthomonas sp. SGNA-20]|uniref:ArnT family glycosyltransferase n=1 Tax=unclassified Pseudoxanthomonas TaxID=2645906 RepID=UPI0002FDC4B1|nr:MULTISPECIES: glycosyltransferase family 39 protein [unclassified Pseudoxanthomonas]RRN55912.1 glycosyltransferase family 39 protein [Pseudoxanthomonas sp. SGNA-20]RRN79188.1 glycosyltransferase family 39 protein [Pseudoxanthomonas sp. SGD-10]